MTKVLMDTVFRPLVSAASIPGQQACGTPVQSKKGARPRRAIPQRGIVTVDARVAGARENIDLMQVLGHDACEIVEPHAFTFVTPINTSVGTHLAFLHGLRTVATCEGG